MGKYDYKGQDSFEEGSDEEGSVAALLIQCAVEDIPEAYGYGFSSILIVIADTLDKVRNQLFDLKAPMAEVMPICDFEVDHLLSFTDQQIDTPEERILARQWMCEKVSEMASFIELEVNSGGFTQTEILFEPVVSQCAWQLDEEGESGGNIKIIRVCGGRIPVIEGAAQVTMQIMNEVREYAIKHEGLNEKVLKVLEKLGGKQIHLASRYNKDLPPMNDDEQERVKMEIEAMVRFTKE